MMHFKELRGIVVVGVAAALSVALLMGQGSTAPNDEKAKLKAANKAKQNAKNFENNASILTFYDRSGKKVGTAGERALYDFYYLSPDRTRVAVVIDDQDAQNADLWILDIASGKKTRLTTSVKDEFVQTPVWSPDGKQVAYTQIRGGREGVYRRAANGEGPEELLYQNPGAFANLSDWSMDGRFLSLAKSDLSGGVLYILPITGEGERKLVEIYKSSSQLFGPRFSPDGRYVSYQTFKAGQRNEVFVRPVEASAKVEWRVGEGSGDAAFWRRDGKELYYIAPDRSVMAVAIKTGPTFAFEKPKVLFHPPGAVPVSIDEISRDGERFAAIPPPRGPQLQQLTIYDREGKVVSKVGEPGILGGPAFSPDGKRVLVMRQDLKTSQRDIWTFDVGTGKGKPVTNDLQPKGSAIWSRDGRQILYVSFRDNYNGVYRRAADGSGSEELLFRYTPGAGLNITDISPDGKFLACASGGVILMVPLTGSDPLARKAIEFSREEFNVNIGRFSPDGRFLAYISDEADVDRNEVYVRGFNGSTGMAGEGKWQLSKDGALGMELWRQDGKEFFFRQFIEPGKDDMVVMAAQVSTSPTFEAGVPKVLFKLSGPQGGSLQNISQDGQRFVFARDVAGN